MTSRARVAAVLPTGLLVVALAGCAVAGHSSGPGARPPQPLKEGSSTSASPTPSATATPTAAPTPLAEVPSLTGVHTRLTLGQGFLQTLTSQGLKATATGAATLSNAGLLTLPITGGSLRVLPGTGATGSPVAQGSIAHQGSGLQLSSGPDKRVGLRDLVIDPESGRVTGTVSLNGKVTSTGVPIFDLDPSGFQQPTTTPTGGVVLRGGALRLTTQSAGLLTQAFGANELASQQVGTVVITAK